ncbi:D-alanyl-D-alanine carboxypeptidase/D-alanyl-D-alanine-endopeptidase [bacterium]|nr:D-alanyl-D-alanine carboxypeptidase/D-alanyl-D-alanine-endopeptidase [bacterium]
MKSFAVLLISLLLPILCTAAPRDGEVRQLTQRGAAARGHWGVYAVNLSSGAEVADYQSRKLFLPASNRKLVTAAMAAKYMGGDATVRTVAHVPSISGGIVQGDLTIEAVGDPTWNGEFLGGRLGRSVLARLADQIADAGVKRVKGDLVIDTSRFAEPAPIPPGWTWEDFQTIDGAIPSVFGIEKNLGRVVISPGSVGSPVRVSFSSPVEPFEILNLSTTGSAGSAPTLQLDRGLAGKTLTITGSISSDSGEAARSMPLGEPVAHAARVLLEELADAGVHVDGNIRLSEAGREMGQVVAAVTSATVGDLLQEMNIPSDNFLAESTYLLAGAELYGRGSYNSSHAAEKRFWGSLDVEDWEWVPMDGSGLSRKNLVTPHALVELLREMHDDEAFVDSLPVSGVNGTMRYRLTDGGLARRVRAKTGTLDGVAALSGYVTTNNGSQVAFSIMVNNADARATTLRRTVDDIVEVLAR